jgi:DNA-binding GntR family transcriptional regulator
MRPEDVRDVVKDDVPEAAYMQVADDLAARILDGSVSGRLPSERDLAEDYYGVSYGTVRHAMDILRELKLIKTVHGRGTFAIKPEDTSAVDG